MNAISIQALIYTYKYTCHIHVDALKNIDLFPTIRGSVWFVYREHTIDITVSFAWEQHWSNLSDMYFPTHGYSNSPKWLLQTFLQLQFAAPYKLNIGAALCKAMISVSSVTSPPIGMVSRSNLSQCNSKKQSSRKFSNSNTRGTRRGYHCITSTPIKTLAPQRCGSNFESVISKHMLRIKFKSTSCKIATEQLWWWVNIGSGNGLVGWGNMPLREPMLTQIYVAIWCQ